MDYYFYILEKNPEGRVGFGVTGSPNARLEDYISHNGREMTFPYVYKGPAPHVRKLEKVIKRQYHDRLWHPFGRLKEWFLEEYSVEDVNTLVNEIVVYQHLPVELYCENFEFTV
jgi:hypothetical protein